MWEDLKRLEREFGGLDLAGKQLRDVGLPRNPNQKDLLEWIVRSIFLYYRRSSLVNPSAIQIIAFLV